MMKISDFQSSSKVVSRKKNKTHRCTAIIGETFNRVLWAAWRFRSENPEVFEPVTFAGEEIILQRGNNQTPFATVAHFNVAWIRSVMARMCHIIDIGFDYSRTDRGPYYAIELEETSVYFNKRYEFVPPSDIIKTPPAM